MHIGEDVRDDIRCRRRGGENGDDIYYILQQGCDVIYDVSMCLSVTTRVCMSVCAWNCLSQSASRLTAAAAAAAGRGRGGCG